MKKIIYIDIELNSKLQIGDLGALSNDNMQFHSNNINDFELFIKDNDFLCGHNIINHDVVHLKKKINNDYFGNLIDTLLLSPLLFPKKPYHNLVKDDVLINEDINNPLSDCMKAKDLFNDELSAFNDLPSYLKNIYYLLLKDTKEFSGFFKYLDCHGNGNVINLILKNFEGKICSNANLLNLIENSPIELAYALAIIGEMSTSLTPPWVSRNYPKVDDAIRILRGKKCETGCPYCDVAFNEITALKKHFGYSSFRSYDGKSLQQEATIAAIEKKSILAIFPTGGGKSITFQLPALMSGEQEKGLTVVISPLQSLMKDQVDNLQIKHGIIQAVTINGMLDPIARKQAFESVSDGLASILYISPESLRSKSIETLLLKRKVVRFVIDEAHCFSSWGQDFRVDYLYIAEFIKSYKEKKGIEYDIPVSCFTATAKQKVIDDIVDYFKQNLNIELLIFRASAKRTNLQYHVQYVENDIKKYAELRNLLKNNYPTIIYVSRTKKTRELADQLTADGYPALPFNGKMDKQDKIANQDKFMKGEVNTIVATTAFGMGVDKDNVKQVIHYNISDSLENYVQEAGRAGRDENLNADCYILFNEDDMNKHFILQNQTKLSLKEIQQVWKAIKDLTKFKDNFSRSALEIARVAGWDETIQDIETRVVTAISALEQANLIKRGHNMPRVYATSILVDNMSEARQIIDNSSAFDDTTRTQAVRILSSLLSQKHIYSKNLDDVAESRVDYIADMLGYTADQVMRVVGLLREVQILSDTKDMTVLIRRKNKENLSLNILKNYQAVENYMAEYLFVTENFWNLKELNENMISEKINSNLSIINTILNYWAQKHIITKKTDAINYVKITPVEEKERIIEKIKRRNDISVFISKYLFDKASKSSTNEKFNIVEFSFLEIYNALLSQNEFEKITNEDIENALFYLSKIDAFKIEGAFAVFYSSMSIDRIELDNKIRYKKEDYSKLEQFYKGKIEQIHIVGEYAKKMVENYKSALIFVEDYFSMDYNKFINKYFKGRNEEITKNLTPTQYNKIIKELSPSQLDVVRDTESKYIVVAAGPGSGKTKLLVHKLASIAYLEDIKYEQMLMLTFSRSSVTEFKKRLLALIGNAANFIQIKTFHSFCFDLLGRVGSVEKSDEIIPNAVSEIREDNIERSKITKTMLVIDEAQDMSANEFELVKSLIEKNEDLRIIAVGDDDQNIYEFRESSSKYLQSLITEYGATKYELNENYRSKKNIVEFSALFAKKIQNRIKNNDVLPISKVNGNIVVTKYDGGNLAIPVVTDILKKQLTGTTCVLTKTNADAYNIVGLLTKHKIPAKVIQSNNNFTMYNLVEIRTFYDEVMKKDENFTISIQNWQLAKDKIKKRFADSINLENCLQLIQDYEDANTKTIYKSDFEQYIKESKIEDFANASNSCIMVSTIHQAKGKEYDNVFLALNEYPEELLNRDLRVIYVAITRAKKNLFIHYIGDYFDSIYADNTKNNYDSKIYDIPSRLIINLAYKDIHLGNAIRYQNILENISSGAKLSITERYCLYDNYCITTYSNEFYKKLQQYYNDGYAPDSAIVKNIVYWKNKNDGKEYLVVLPEIQLIKENGQDINLSMIENKEDYTKEEQEPKKEITYPFDSGLYENLRQIRVELSRKINQPAYCIMKNNTLEEIVKKRPLDKASFLSIYGLNETQYDDFGMEFIAAIQEYMDKNKS